jgi:hypothetical protein
MAQHGFIRIGSAESGAEDPLGVFVQAGFHGSEDWKLQHFDGCPNGIV